MSFDDFLGKHNSREAEKQQKEADKPKRRSDWISSINQVFEHIQGLMKPYLDSKKLTFTYGQAYSNDVDLSMVEVKMLTITGSTGKGRGARFTPLASVGFGNRGIIEVKPTETAHRAGPSQDMLLVRKGDTRTVSDWKFRMAEQPNSTSREVEYYDLTAESMQNLLQRMMS